jgi:hypothetical protein
VHARKRRGAHGEQKQAAHDSGAHASRAVVQRERDPERGDQRRALAEDEPAKRPSELATAVLAGIFSLLCVGDQTPEQAFNLAVDTFGPTARRFPLATRAVPRYGRAPWEQAPV